jgi:hypothetical protein
MQRQNFITLVPTVAPSDKLRKLIGGFQNSSRSDPSSTRSPQAVVQKTFSTVSTHTEAAPFLRTVAATPEESCAGATDALLALELGP